MAVGLALDLSCERRRCCGLGVGRQAAAIGARVCAAAGSAGSAAVKRHGCKNEIDAVVVGAKY
eukprot:1893765-Pleurochrysis_carterae.AAC.1